MDDLRQSPQYKKFIKTLGWKVVSIKAQKKQKQIHIFIKKIPPLPFSLIKIQRPSFIPFKKIKEIAQKYHALFIKIEPEQKFGNLEKKQLKIHGYHQDSWPLLPTKTIWIDLKKSEKQIWETMRKKTRYCIRKAKQNNLAAKRLFSDSAEPVIEQFHQQFKKFGKGYIPQKQEFQSLLKAFDKNAILLSVDKIAGALILTYDQTAYYYYAFTSPFGRKLFAQHLLIWEAIRLAKKLNCQIFDLEGIKDFHYQKGNEWKGFSNFKKSFGGKEIIFPGSFTKYSFPGFT